jgi:hypothetical protein
LLFVQEFLCRVTSVKSIEFFFSATLSIPKRLLRRIFEIDSLLCPEYEVEMKVNSVITEPALVDETVRDVSRGGGVPWRFGTPANAVDGLSDPETGTPATPHDMKCRTKAR